jgi:hypothetical protein
MSKVIFKDPAHQLLFAKQGYIVLPFIDLDEVTELNQIFDDMHTEIEPSAGFVSGSYSSDFEYKKKASDAIVKIFSKHYDRLFKDYQAFGAAFLYKMPNANSQLSIHQDWTIVDEERYVALNCWVPLTDVNASNGAIHVVPSTHYDQDQNASCTYTSFLFYRQ